MTVHALNPNHEDWCRNCTVLRQCLLPLEKRWIPVPQMSPVWDRTYTSLLSAGRLRWVRTDPVYQSLSDYLETVP